MGLLAIDGQPFCSTLEPTDRHLTAATITPERKVFGRTAIPTGTYIIELTYSVRFRCTLPLLRDVPCFEGIRIHAGNTRLDTSGCILVGREQAPGRLIDSRLTLRLLLARLNTRSRTQALTIEIRD